MSDLGFTRPFTIVQVTPIPGMDQLLTKEPEEKEWQTLYELLWTHRSNGIFSKQEYSVPRCHYDEHPESDDESFPTTFTSISLHPVDWPAKLPCQEARILVRPCFYEMYEEMKSCEGSLAIFGEIFTGNCNPFTKLLLKSNR